uniref:Arf-GAP with Rho-GAP domain, ANK repeat and PH domain-containing protein 1 isoform c n=1 Tax=Sus scrofa TaxID=9823 RepID=A0A480KBD2_PIG
MAEAGDAALSVAEWLRALHLEQYARLFEQHGLVWATECQGLSDARLVDMGVLLPGHRRRILAGLLRAHTPPAPAPRPAPRPVPMKRHVFRSPPVPAAPPEPLPTAGEDEGLPTAPPIPPRRSCIPPACFSTPSAAAPDPVLPPLPAKRHLPEQCVPPVPPRTGPPRPLVSLPTKEKELLLPPASSPPQPGPEEPPAVFPRGPPQPPTPPPSPPAIPPKPLRPLPEFDDSDYDEVPEEGPGAPAAVMTKKEERPASQVPRAVRVASLLSEGEELSGDDPGDEDEDDHAYEGVPNGGWHTSSLSSALPGSLLTPELPPPPMDGPPVSQDPSPVPPVIKAGWLDKNPPQGSYIYQKRWVRLDASYLQYFDSNKDAYSKRFVPVACISRVAAIGDQKFEVITNNRTFAFRAESDAERKEWIQALQQAVAEQRARARLSSAYPLGAGGSEPPDRAGSLELRGFKNKLYVAVVGDKVQLYKNLEEYHLGIGITFIDMSVGNVKEAADRRSFDLTTPYRIFSFSAESELEKEQWLEAMQGAIAEALSTSEVAERIWAVAPNRFCADCEAAQPDWASINLCVVICKRCAGAHRGLGAGVSKVRSLKMDRKVWTEVLIEVGSQLYLGSASCAAAPHQPQRPGARPSGSSSGWDFGKVHFWQSQQTGR